MKRVVYFLACLCAVVFASCDPDFNKPDSGQDSSESGNTGNTGNSDGDVSFEMPDDEIGEKPADDSYVRISVEMKSQDSDARYRFSEIVNMNALSAVDIPDVPDGKYELYAWADGFSSHKDITFFYDVMEFSCVSFAAGNYAGVSNGAKTAYYVSQRDVVVDGNKRIDFEMKRPHGAYKVTLRNPQDIMEFNKKGYTSVVEYSGFLPSGFNVYNERIVDSVTGAGYTVSLPVITDQTGGVCVAEDIVLCSNSGTVVLVFTIKDNEGNEVYRSSEVEVRLERGTLIEVLHEADLTNELN